MESESQNLIGIFTTDVDLKVQLWDAALERISGISSKDALGRSITDLILDLDGRSLLKRFRRVLDEGTVEVLAPAFHKYLIKSTPTYASKRFQEMRQQVSIAPLKEGDSIKGLIVSIEDVTLRMDREIDATESLKDPELSVRLDAAHAISTSDAALNGENVAPIIEGLGDSNWKVRRKLVEGMSHRAAPEAIQALLYALKERHLDFAVVNSALQILRANSVNTSDALVEFLQAEETDLRMHAALALGEQNDPRVIPALIDAVNDSDENVKYHAIEALGKLKARNAVEPLLKVIETRDFFLSFAALDALGEIADESAAGRLVSLLDDPGLREPALRVIGTTGSLKAISRLIGLLNEDNSLTNEIADSVVRVFERFDDNDDDREEMVNLARQSIDARGRANLLSALFGELVPRSHSAILLAGWFDDESLINKLTALLSDSDVRESAAAALVMQANRAIDFVVTELENEDPEIRRTVVHILGQIGDSRAASHLIKVIETEELDDRLAAIDALAQLADEESLTFLSNLAEDAESRIRQHAVRGLGESKDSLFADVLLRAVSDPDERVRQVALEQLPNILGERSIPTLIQALQDDIPRIRAAVVQILSRFETRDSVNAIRKALDDSDPWTRYFAVRGIGILKDLSSRNYLATITENDPAEQVRIAAREVMIELGS